MSSRLFEIGIEDIFIADWELALMTVSLYLARGGGGARLPLDPPLLKGTPYTIKD